MSPQEWDNLPWYRQREFFEGYEWEGLVKSGDEPMPTTQDGSSTHDLASPDADLSPFTVRRA